MKRSLSSLLLRELKAVEFLNCLNDSQSVSIQEISEVLNCSLITSNNTLKSIEEKYPYIKLIYSQNTINIKFDLDTNMITFYRDIFKQSLSAHILKTIFLNGQITSEVLSKALYVSTSTLKRKIQDLNDTLLLDFNIKISSSPHSFVGKEIDIRRFFIVFFSEQDLNETWSFIKIPKNTLKLFIKTASSLFNLDVDLSREQFLTILFAINYTRVKQGFFISNDIKEFYCIPQNEIDELTIYLKSITNESELFLNVDELLDILTPYLVNPYYSSYSELKDQRLIKDDVEYNYSNIVRLVNRFSNEFDLTIHDYEHIILELYNSLIFSNVKNYSEHILYNKYHSTLTLFKAEFPQIYQYLESEFETLIIDTFKRNDSGLVLHMIYSFIINWKYLFKDLYSKRENVKVTVISDTDYNHDQWLVEILEKNLIDQAKIYRYPFNSFDINNLESLPSDIIVTNFPIDAIDGKQTVLINNVPSIEDISNINKLVEYLSYKSKSVDF